MLVLLRLVLITLSCSVLAASARGGSTLPVLHISLTGSDAGRCTQTAPCLSFARAYRVAHCGQTVEVAAGTYPGAQMVKADNPGLASGCSSYVVFEPAQGATVTLGCPGTGNVGCGPLGLGSSDWAPGCCSDGQQGPSWVEFKNFVFRGSWEVGGGDHILLENDHGPSAGNVRDTTNFTMHGGDYGPCQSPSTSPRTTPCDHNMSFDGNGASSVLIDGVTFHDFSLVNPDHFECMVVFGAASMTIQNSRFYNCMIYDVAFSLGNTPSGVVVQNNWFGDATNGWALNFMYNGHPDSNVLIRYNSFSDGNAITQSSGSLSNVEIDGNILGTRADCLPAATYHANLWQAGRCVDDDLTRVPFGYALVSNQLAHDGQKAAAVRLIFRQLARKDTKLATVLKALRRGRFPSPHGRWSAGAVKAVVADPFYNGGRLGRRSAQPLVAAATARSAAKNLGIPPSR